MIVPRVRTPVAIATLPEALDAAHHRLRGFALTPDAYRLADAQLELEHGTDGAGNLRGVFCFNFGNHDASAADLADPSVPIFATVPEHEEDPHGRGYLQVHHRRAYEDAEAGLVGYWTAMLGGFPTAYQVLVDTADPTAFAHALKSGEPGRPYFTADAGVYAHALRRLLDAIPPTDPGGVVG